MFIEQVPRVEKEFFSPQKLFCFCFVLFCIFLSTFNLSFVDDIKPDVDEI
jgi:hypothetical protein